MKPLRVAAMVSGGGTTAKYILEQTQKGGGLFGSVKIVCLIASKENIGAIDKFKKAKFGGKIYICNPKDSNADFANRLLRILNREKVDIFGQYGWLAKTPELVAKKYMGINQHPAPVPYFGGKGMYSLAPHQAVLNFAKLSNRPIETVATAQIVHPEYDLGRIIAEVPLEVNWKWSADELQKKLLPLEWQCQVLALLRIIACNGKIPPAIKSAFELLSGEEKLLKQAKNEAILKYPHG